MASRASGSNNVVEDLIELSDQNNKKEYMNFFVTQQIADRLGFIGRMGPEVNTIRNQLGHLELLIVGLETLEDVGPVRDSLMYLRHDHRRAVQKMADMQHWVTVAEEDIEEKQKWLKK